MQTSNWLPDDPYFWSTAVLASSSGPATDYSELSQWAPQRKTSNSLSSTDLQTPASALLGPRERKRAKGKIDREKDGKRDWRDDVFNIRCVCVWWACMCMSVRDIWDYGSIAAAAAEIGLAWSTEEDVICAKSFAASNPSSPTPQPFPHPSGSVVCVLGGRWAICQCLRQWYSWSAYILSMF